MTLLSDKERKQGLEDLGVTDYFKKNLKLGPNIVPKEDMDYFRDKLARIEKRGASEESILRIRKQIELLEDASIIYREIRLAEE